MSLNNFFKRNMFFRIAAITLLLSFSVFHVTSIAFAANTYDDFTYSILDNGSVRIDKFSNMYTEHLEVPSSINGMVVTEINARAFMHKRNLLSVTIPKSIITIGQEAFSDCLSLKTVNFGVNVKNLGAYAFNNCTSLSAINLLNIESIGDKCFYNCTSLKAVDMGNSLVSIGSNSFSNCYKLSEITFSPVLLDVGDYAFSKCKELKSVTLPDTLKSIGNSAFTNCDSLENVTFGKGMLSIGAYCFENCPSLLKVTVPPNVMTIGSRAFVLRSGTDFSHSDGFSITCQKGSSAQVYCNQNNIKSVLKDFKMLFLIGDLNGNGKVEVIDARTVLRFCVDLEKYTPEQMYYADFDKSGTLEITDARQILRVAVGLSA